MARLKDNPEANDHSHKRVKREPGPSSLPGLRGKGKGRSEVIDLTIDD